MNLRDLISDWLWDRRYARLEHEADRLRRGRVKPPLIVWANGTWGIWSHATDKRLAEIETEQAFMCGFEAPHEMSAPSTTIH